MTRASQTAIAVALTFAWACGSDDAGLFGDGEAGNSGAGAASGEAGSSAGAAPDASVSGAAGRGIGGQSGSGNAGQGGTIDAAAGSAGSDGGAGKAGAGGGGQTGTPGTIACGGNPLCATSFNVCCSCPGCAIPYPTTCFPILTGCTGTGNVMTCDDAADCQGGVCCAHFSPPSYDFTGASCEQTCPDEGNAQLCTTDGECPPDRVCKKLASLPGFRACQPK